MGNYQFLDDVPQLNTHHMKRILDKILIFVEFFFNGLRGLRLTITPKIPHP